MTPMMTREAAYAYMAGQGFQAIALPYRGGVSMVVLVPDAGQLDSFEKTLNNKRLQSVLDGLKPQAVRLTIPKFNYQSPTISLNQPLARLGIVDAFQAGVADFSGMDGTRDLFISDCYHKAMVRADEDGTEAAAATAMAVDIESARKPPLTLIVDRPFVFVIRDDSTGAVLFVGRIANPKAS